MKKLLILWMLIVVASSLGAQQSNRNLGINLFAPQLDYCQDRMFTDVMKTAREWYKPNWSDVPAEVDDLGWPTEDARLVVWHGIGQMHGIYKMQGESNNIPVINAAFGSAAIENLTFSNGIFSADLVYSSTDGSGLQLEFLNTGGGVRNVRLMRPVFPGSSVSYLPEDRFTHEVKNLVADFQVVRFMWFTGGWNGPDKIHWADRVPANYCSFARGGGDANASWVGYGAAWEWAIWFANETGKDMYLNIPIAADDDYIQQLAQLCLENYTVPNGKIYVEYANEISWCGGAFPIWQYHKTQTEAEAIATDVLDYDGETDINVLMERRVGQRSVEVSNIWRQVWGDTAMHDRIRPVACGHLEYDSELIIALDFVHSYYNNANGNHVEQPHPVNYFLYGAGASNYTMNDNPDSLMPNGFTGLQYHERFIEEEAALAKMYGIKRIAYEGGIWTNESNWQLPRIRKAMIDHQHLWESYDGDLLTYYVTTGGEENGHALGFTDNAYDLNKQKYLALDSILNSPVAAITAAKVVPCEIQAADFSVCAVAWEHPEPGGNETFGPLEMNQWRSFSGYLFRVDTAAVFRISIDYTNYVDADLELMVDGQIIGREIMNGTPRFFEVALNPGLHGLRLKIYTPDYFLLEKINILKGPPMAVDSPYDSQERQLMVLCQPNPVENLLILEITLHETGPVLVQIMTRDGRLIYEKDAGKLTNGKHRLEIDTDVWPSGVYSCLVSTGKEIAQQSLLKLNK